MTTHAGVIGWPIEHSRSPMIHGHWLKRYGIELQTSNIADNQTQPFDTKRALEVLEVSFSHPIRLIANALGVPPKEMLEMGRKHDVPVAALVGAKEHAVRQVAAGVDILVAQGTEAGGHCGEVSTMVLVPEVVANVEFGGAKRNHLFICGTTSLYTVKVMTNGAKRI